MVIRTVDTDVLVLAVSVYEQLQEEMEELWVEFGAGKNKKFFPIQETLENVKLVVFHRMWSSFVSVTCHQKCSLEIWNLLDDVTPIFAALSHQPTFTQIQDAMPTIERFTDLLYSRT